MLRQRCTGRVSRVSGLGSTCFKRNDRIGFGRETDSNMVSVTTQPIERNARGPYSDTCCNI